MTSEIQCISCYYYYSNPYICHIRLYAVSLKGGSPFDKEIQPHITSKPQNQQSTGFLQTVLAGERVAKVVVRVTAPTQEILEQLEYALI